MMRPQYSADYANAAIDCTSAGFAACAAMTAMSFDCWRQSFDLISPTPSVPRSWYKKPSFASSGRSFHGSSASWPAWPQASWPPFSPWFFPYANPSPASLGNAWLAMFPLQGPPASWPLAFAMIANGMPRSLALPVAEANVAVAEAAEAATRPLRRAMTAYRGDGGHAVSLFTSPHAAMFGALAIGMGNSAWPWFSAPPSPFII